MPQERKVATVLFADLVDSTARSGSLDPEILRGAMARTFAAMRQALSAHGGTVEKFVGDAVMAVFGVPTAHDDDAERAVRAAFALLDLTRSGIGAPLRLELRIGVNTGETASGMGGESDFLVTGQAVVVAARLEQAARPGTIFVGSLTRKLTEGAISYEPAVRVPAKGFGEIEASEATSLRSARPTAGRATSLRSPLVDRDREMRILDTAREEVLARHRPFVVTIFGAPGVGKSRLVSEFIDRADPAVTLRGRCLPYGEGITYWPVREMVADRAAPTEATADAVTAAMARDAPEAELTPAFRDFVERALDGRSWGLILFEDIQWAEAPLLDLFENVASRTRGPALFVCLSRPELLERRTTWGGGRTDAAAITLDPLPPADTDVLVRQLLGGVDPPTALRHAVRDRTEGNPLYVEEFLRMLIDSQVIRGTGGRWDLPSAITLAVPDSLHGIIAARLDHLPSPLKLLLQRASVVGRTFWTAALVELGEDPAVVEAELGVLVARDFLEETTEPGPHDVTGYRFRHVLVRDVAYEALSKVERIGLHDACGRWLESLSSSGGGEYRDLVAYHAGQAFDLARELNDARAMDLGRRALDLLLAAGARARRRADQVLARSLFERAVVVADAIGADPARRAEAEGYAALMQHRLEPSGEALDRVDRAIVEARDAGANGALVALLTWRGTFTLNESVERARPLFDEAVRLGRELGDPEVEVHALMWSTEPLHASGDLDGELEVLRLTLARARETGARGPLVSCLVALTDNALHRADLAAARSWLAETIAAAAASESKLDRYKAIDVEARVVLAEGDVEGATEIAQQALEFISEVGTPGAIAHACETLADALLAAGDAASARATLDRALLALGPASLPTYRSPVEWRLARAHLALGDIGAASTAASAAVRDVAQSDVLGSAQAKAALAAAREASPELDEATVLRQEAIAALRGTGYRAALASINAEAARA